MSQDTSKTSQQYRCDVCGQICNSQTELDEHYKSKHTERATTRNQSTQERGTSGTATAARWSGQGVEYSSDTNAGNTEETSVKGGEGSSRTWREATEDELKDMGERGNVKEEGGSDRAMPIAYGEKTGERAEKETNEEQKTQSQFKCRHCGQIFTSQSDIDRHNKNIHGIES